MNDNFKIWDEEEKDIQTRQEEDEDYGYLTINYHDAYNNNTFSASFQLTEEDIFWDSLLRKFVNFLEGSGFYVKGRVAVKESPYANQNWDGPTFNDDK